MKLLKVEYLEESSTAIFFNVEYETKKFWSAPKIYTKRAYLGKCKYSTYNHYFSWADNSEWFNNDKAFIEEMILQYEKRVQ